MSDSKKDLTRIEDLGEYLHQLDDDEDYLPDLPDESEPPQFMEETLINSDEEDPFTSNDQEESSSFESEISDFGSDNEFSDESFQNDDQSDFPSGDSFGQDTDFSESSEFDNQSSFDSNDEFSSFDNFDSSSNFSSEDDFSASNEDESLETTSFDSIPSEDEDAASTLEVSDHHIDGDQTTLIAEELVSEEIESLQKDPFDFPPLADETPSSPEELVEKTTITPSPQTTSFKAPESFDDLKKFAENTSFTGMASEGNPSFSVLLKEIKYQEDAQDILILLKELGLAMDDDEVLIKRLNRGDFLVPRISEFAATLLAHKLRRFDIDILVGPSDQIQPPKHGEEPEVGLVSKQSLFQNQSHHFQFGEFNLDISQIIVSATPTLDGYQVIKYIGVASEHKMLEGHLVEDENSLEISTHYNELAQRLKAHALKSQANAVVGLNYQLTPLPSHFGSSNTRYRLTCTGNLVWINKI